MNHFKEVLKLIKDSEKYAVDEQAHHSDMFRHFIELMEEDGFNVVFIAYFINSEDSFEENFFMFHKSMRQCDFYDIEGGGHIDMLFWNFVHISELPFLIFKKHLVNYEVVKPFLANIGKRVIKDKSGKPFKSGQKTNTIKDVVFHDFIGVPAYTFEEDGSYVECRRCEIIDAVKLTEHQIEILNTVSEGFMGKTDTRTLRVLENKGLLRTVKTNNFDSWEMTDKGIDELNAIKKSL